MSIQEITAYVLQTAKDYGSAGWGNDPTPESLVVRDLGFDDLDVIEFVMAIEDLFSISFDSDFEPDECVDLTLQQLIDMAVKALGLADEVAP